MADSVRAPSGQALVSDEAPSGLHPSGFDPSRERLFSEEFPHVSSCLQMIASYIVCGFVLTGIAAIGGLSAMYWFGGGFLIAALVFLYEAGRNAIAMEARQRQDAEERLDPQGDSAGPQDIAQ